MANLKRQKIENTNANKNHFKRTAITTKKINIQPMNTRGGTRL